MVNPTVLVRTLTTGTEWGWPDSDELQLFKFNIRPKRHEDN